MHKPRPETRKTLNSLIRTRSEVPTGMFGLPRQTLIQTERSPWGWVKSKYSLCSSYSQEEVYVPATLRKKVIRQCHDVKTARHFYYWKTLKREVLQLGGINKDIQVVSSMSSMCNLENSGMTAEGRDEPV